MLFGHVIIEICTVLGMVLSGITTFEPRAFNVISHHANVDRMETKALPPQQLALQEVPSVEFGVCDPAGAFKSATDFRMEHFFIAWEPFDVGKLRHKMTEAAARGATLC